MPYVPVSHVISKRRSHLCSETGEKRRKQTWAASTQSVEQVRIRVWICSEVFSIRRNNLKRKRLITTQSIDRAYRRMPTASHPTPVWTNSVATRRNQCHVITVHILIHLPRLKSSTNSSSDIIIFTLAMFWQKLKAFEMMRPDAERPSTS